MNNRTRPRPSYLVLEKSREATKPRRMETNKIPSPEKVAAGRMRVNWKFQMFSFKRRQQGRGEFHLAPNYPVNPVHPCSSLCRPSGACLFFRGIVPGANAPGYFIPPLRGLRVGQERWVRFLLPQGEGGRRPDEGENLRMNFANATRSPSPQPSPAGRGCRCQSRSCPSAWLTR